MTKIILAPVDGSTFSTTAMQVAIQIAADHGDALVVGLHVVNVRLASGNIAADLAGRIGFEPAVVGQDMYDDHVQTGREVLEAFTAAAQAAGIRSRAVLAEGAVASTIVEHSHHADLVVLGARGESEDRHPGQGGNQVFNIIPDLQTPALIVPKGHTKLSGICIGYDGSAAAAHAVRAVRDVAAPTGIPVHSVYVSADGSGGDVLDRVNDYLPATQVTPHVVTGSQVHQVLANTADTANCNVLALGFHGDNRLKDFLYGSSGEHAMLKSNLCLLIAP